MLISIALELAWQKSIKLAKQATPVPAWSELRNILQQRVTSSHRMAFDAALAAVPGGNADRFGEEEAPDTQGDANHHCDDDPIARRLLAAMQADLQRDLGTKVGAHRLSLSKLSSRGIGSSPPCITNQHRGQSGPSPLVGPPFRADPVRRDPFDSLLDLFLHRRLKSLGVFADLGPTEV
jgi:hypothetical protein